MAEISTTELKTRTGEYVDRIMRGETLTLTRSGRVIGVIVPATHVGDTPASDGERLANIEQLLLTILEVVSGGVNPRTDRD